MFEYLVPSQWNYLGRIRKCGLVRGGVSLEAGFRVSKAAISPVSSLCLVFVDQDTELSATALPPCLPTWAMLLP